jgi:gliding motility-associated-like protein
VKYIRTIFLLILIICINKFDFGSIYPPAKKNERFLSKDDCPKINESAEVVKNSACDKPPGSITGIIVTGRGKLFYTWRNAFQIAVGNSPDLLDVPAGSYTLEVKDGSTCGKAVTFPIEITEINGITIDHSNVKIQQSGCKNIGAITGIKVTGATHIEWKDATTGAVVSTSIDATNLPPGTYSLFAFNTGCSKQGPFYTVSTGFDVPIVTSVRTTNMPCSKFGDSIIVTLNRKPSFDITTYIFFSSAGFQTLGDAYSPNTTTTIVKAANLFADDYSLYFYDAQKGNCPIFLRKITIVHSNLVLSRDSTVLISDQCSQHMGAIIPAFSNNFNPPMGSDYTWTDDQGNIVGRNPTLNNVGEGIYHLSIFVKGCFVFADFTLRNESPVQQKPDVDDVTVCLPSIVNIYVKNIDTVGIYKLTTLTDTTPIATSKTGTFYRKVNKTTDFNVVHQIGECKSEVEKVTVTVVADINIPNAFTPNNDGINDQWNINGIDRFPGADVKIFSRNGQLIFHSVNYPEAFDGIVNGSVVPDGTYYYIIDVKQPICYGKISGSLTIIR